MDYPADGTPSELDSKTVHLLCDAAPEPDDGKTLIAGVLYDNATGYEAEEEEPPQEYDDNDTGNPYPRDREDGEGLVLPGYGD